MYGPNITLTNRPRAEKKTNNPSSHDHPQFLLSPSQSSELAANNIYMQDLCWPHSLARYIRWLVHVLQLMDNIKPYDLM